MTNDRARHPASGGIGDGSIEGRSPSTPIDVQHLTKRYDAVTALSDISFSVQPGEVMGFLGPNGAGKTTTLRILTGMIAPTSGSVRIDGLDVTERSLEVRRRIGYMPENVALYPELRVHEYLAYRARIKGVGRHERRARLAAAMEQCAVVEVSRQLIGRLSKGYRQRVALADCLIGKPKILILDEPTVGLDPHQIRQTRDLIMALGQTTTILLSTHILPEVEMTCQRVAIIDKGRIVAVDTPERLRQQLQGAQLVQVQLRGDAEAIERALKQVPGVARVTAQGRASPAIAPRPSAVGGTVKQEHPGGRDVAPIGADVQVLRAEPVGLHGFASFEIETTMGADVREAIFHLAVERQWALLELAHVRASLEDIFIHLTTREHEDPAGQDIHAEPHRADLQRA